MRTFLGKVGELVLKGSNLPSFEKLLAANVRASLAGTQADVRVAGGRLYIRCEDDAGERIVWVLDHLLGITGWAEARVCDKNIDAIRAAVLEEARLAAATGARSFKIDARRGDKTFPLTSYEICCQAASPVFDSGLLFVDVHTPDVTITVEVREQCFVYGKSCTGRRGLPVGCSGKGLLLLSGGLDSPVAGYRMMRRGMKIDCAYFHAHPYTSRQAQEKVERLAALLAGYGIVTHLTVIPFTNVQLRIKERAPRAFTTLMLRACMMRCANLLAARVGADCIVTGESMGQVASQTVENLAVTESFAEKPLCRPLIGMDKEEIIATAEEIGTYATSILPYEDCCVLFSPRHPVLRAGITESHAIYESLDVDMLVQEAFAQREVLTFSATPLNGTSEPFSNGTSPIA